MGLVAIIWTANNIRNILSTTDLFNTLSPLTRSNALHPLAIHKVLNTPFFLSKTAFLTPKFTKNGKNCKESWSPLCSNSQNLSREKGKAKLTRVTLQTTCAATYSWCILVRSISKIFYTDLLCVSKLYSCTFMDFDFLLGHSNIHSSCVCATSSSFIPLPALF